MLRTKILSTVGEYAAVLMQEDFGIFSDRLDDYRKQGELLEDILDDPDSAASNFSGTDLYTRRDDLPWDTSLATAWRWFCSVIKNDPDAEWEYDSIDRWIKRTARVLPKGTMLFRARSGFDSTDGKRKPWSGVDIGAPPIHKCKPGRVNRMTQRVLYSTEQESTAVSEVRPSRGAIVSVCGLKVLKSLRVADLAKRIASPNPFLSRGLRHNLEVSAVLNEFSHQLASPLARSDDLEDYLPCQYIADRIRAAGLDGIRYRSALVPAGTNVVLFDPDAAQVLQSSLVRVTEVSVTYAR